MISNIFCHECSGDGTLLADETEWTCESCGNSGVYVADRDAEIARLKGEVKVLERALSKAVKDVAFYAGASGHGGAIITRHMPYYIGKARKELEPK